jgi:hypothetical protein
MTTGGARSLDDMQPRFPWVTTSDRLPPGLARKRHGWEPVRGLHQLAQYIVSFVLLIDL